MWILSPPHTSQNLWVEALCTGNAKSMGWLSVPKRGQLLRSGQASVGAVGPPGPSGPTVRVDTWPATACWANCLAQGQYATIRCLPKGFICLFLALAHEIKLLRPGLNLLRYCSDERAPYDPRCPNSLSEFLRLGLTTPLSKRRPGLVFPSTLRAAHDSFCHDPI